MNYRSFNLEDWIGHISGVIEDETTLDGNEMRDLVEFLSTLEPKWIPVSERLPEEDGTYLVTVQNLTGYWKIKPNVFECRYFRGWVFQGWEDNKVIAWMPLPKPYEPQESEVK